MRTFLGWLAFLVSTITRAIVTGLACGLAVLGCVFIWAHSGCAGTGCIFLACLLMWWVISPLLRENP